MGQSCCGFLQSLSLLCHFLLHLLELNTERNESWRVGLVWMWLVGCAWSRGPGRWPTCFKDGVVERVLHCKPRGRLILFGHWLTLQFGANPFSSLNFIVFLGAEKGHITNVFGYVLQPKMNPTGILLSHISRSWSQHQGWYGGATLRLFLSFSFAILDFVLLVERRLLWFPVCLWTGRRKKQEGSWTGVFHESTMQKMSQFMS